MSFGHQRLHPTKLLNFRNLVGVEKHDVFLLELHDLVLLSLCQGYVGVEHEGHLAADFPEVVDDFFDSSEGCHAFLATDQAAKLDDDAELFEAERRLQVRFQLEQTHQELLKLKVGLKLNGHDLHLRTRGRSTCCVRRRILADQYLLIIFNAKTFVVQLGSI